MNRFQTGVALAAALAFVISAAHAHAHGFAGKRFFPATLQTDDPFVADELSFPTVSAFKNGPSSDSPGAWQTDTSVDFSKRITPNFGIGAGETWTRIKPNGGTTQSGFNNLELSAKYLLLENDPHEFLLSIGLDTEIGGTGANRVGADRFNTYTPSVFFGKGLGDLPDGLAYLKPLAVTGSIGYGIPSTSKALGDDGDFEQHPHTLNTDFAIEYNFGYLQSFVRDVGLGAPFNRLIPLVEFSYQTPLDRGQGGKTTGAINPGFIWAGQSYQIGVEAIIPANDRSGNNVGGIVQLHFFLDDLFPNSIGKPVFGG
jgi:hypothetical protein